MADHSYRHGPFDPKKYKIEKSDGTPIEPCARYFVLRYDADRNARYALQLYADSVRLENPGLADDLERELRETEGDFKRHWAEVEKLRKQEKEEEGVERGLDA